jgi:hypothetical protein
MPAILLLAVETKILAFVIKAGFETPSSHVVKNAQNPNGTKESANNLI